MPPFLHHLLPFTRFWATYAFCAGPESGQRRPRTV